MPHFVPLIQFGERDRILHIRYELITDALHWRQLWSNMPSPHILQSWEWSEIKHITTGWRPFRYAFYNGQKLLAIAAFGLRRLGPVRFIYAPRGPLFTAGFPDFGGVLSAIPEIAKEHKATWLKIDPGVALYSKPVGTPDWQEHQEGHMLHDFLRKAGWRHSPQQVQFPNTQKLDLSPSEEALLANMSANTRRKIRLAKRKGVAIRDGNERDANTLYNMYAETAARDGFRIRPLAYYRVVWQRMLRAGMARFFIAEFAGVDIAFSILIHGGNSCWYFYGASSNIERQRMPNYALQWEGICWAKRNGYREYDFWGAPTTFDESDPLWGVYQFKRGFRGCLFKGLGAWDYAPNPARYSIYQMLQRLKR